MKNPTFPYNLIIISTILNFSSASSHSLYSNIANQFPNCVVSFYVSKEALLFSEVFQTSVQPVIRIQTFNKSEKLLESNEVWFSPKYMSFCRSIIFNLRQW